MMNAKFSLLVSIAYSLPGCASAPISASVNKIWGRACTIEWADYRASRGHANGGQCAGTPDEAQIIAIHTQENRLYTAQREKDRAALHSGEALLKDLERRREELRAYEPYRSMMSDEQREDYDRQVAELDKAIHDMRTKHIPNEHARNAALDREIKDLEMEKSQRTYEEWRNANPDTEIPDWVKKVLGASMPQ